MENSVVIHYSEIGTKGKNRDFFEKKLAENTRKALGKSAKQVYRRYGRIVCDLDPDSDIGSMKQILEKLPGISNFSFAHRSKLDLEEIKKDSLLVLGTEDFSSFKVETRRSNKSFPFTSPEINNELHQIFYLQTHSPIQVVYGLALCSCCLEHI